MFSPQLQATDEKIIIRIQNFRFKLLTWVLIFFTWTGMGIFWISVSLLLQVTNRYAPVFNPYLLNAFFAPLLVWMMNYFLKKKFGRTRPANTNKSILALVKVPLCDSFPSSHAGSTFSFFFILMWWQFPGAWWFGVWAAIVSFSRMYLGVHFLTDIVGGILVGLLASGVIYLIF